MLAEHLRRYFMFIHKWLFWWQAQDQSWLNILRLGLTCDVLVLYAGLANIWVFQFLTSKKTLHLIQ